MDCRKRSWGLDWPLITRQRTLAQLAAVLVLVFFALPTAERVARKVWSLIQPSEQVVEDASPGAAAGPADVDELIAVAGLGSIPAPEAGPAIAFTSSSAGPTPFLFVDPNADGEALTIELRTKDPVTGFELRESDVEEQLVVQVPGDWVSVRGFAVDIDHELAQRIELGAYSKGLEVVVDLKTTAVAATISTHQTGLSIRIEPDSELLLTDLGVPSG